MMSIPTTPLGIQGRAGATHDKAAPAAISTPIPNWEFENCLYGNSLDLAAK